MVFESHLRGWLEDARAGDAEAFGELCRAYEGPLFRQAMTLCRNASLAEDLAQDTFIEAWKSLGRYKGECQFFTWLCAILLNRFRNSLRARQPVPLSALQPAELEDFHRRLDTLTDPEASPDEAAQAHEQAALVLDCITALSPRHFQVVYLRFYVDQSLEGIAAALGCSIGTVKSRLFNALENLRAQRALAKPATGREQKVSHV